MFDTALHPYLTSTAPRVLPKMSGYLQTLNQEVLYNIHRYTRGSYLETPGMMLLETIIGSAPLSDILKEPDQYQRYRKYIAPIRESLERLFDPVQMGGNHQASFINSGTHGTHQYLFAVGSDSVYSDYPMGQAWMAWSRYRPFRVASLLTNELSFHTYEDQIKYNRDIPSLGIFTIDVCALVLMYSVYYETLTADIDRQFALPTFLHRYVVFPALTEDNTNLWIRNQYLESLVYTKNEDNGPHRDYAWITANNGRIGSQYPQFFQDILYLKQQCVDSSILPNTYLSSLKMLGGMSCLDYYKNFLHKNTTPPLRQYSWTDYLIYEKWIELFIRAACLYPQWSSFRYLNSYLTRDLQLFQSSHPWGDLADNYTKSYIQTSIDEKLSLINTAASITA